MRNRIISALCYAHGILLIILFLPMIHSWAFPDDMGAFYRSFLVLVPFCLTRLLEKRCKGLLSFLLVCVLSMLPGLLLPGREQIPFFLYSILLTIICIYARIRQSEDPLLAPAGLTILIFVVLYFFSMIIHIPLLGQVAYYCTFAYILVYLWYTNLTRVDHFIAQNQDMSNFPKKQIGRTSTGLLVLFSGILVAACVFFQSIGLERFIARLGDALLQLIRLLFQNHEDNAPTEMTTVATTEAPGSPDMGLPTAPDSPEWLKVVLDALTYVFFAAVIVGAIVLLIYALIHLFQKFYQAPTENNDKQEFIRPEVKADRVEKPKKEKSQSLTFQFHPDAQVRKHYKKKIKGQKKKIISSALTPSQLEDYVELPKDEGTKRLHQLYEKARYSQTGCTKEDVETLRKS